MENTNQRDAGDPECLSSASSMSFILAEEIEASMKENADVEVGLDSLAVMTRSQYAQVIK